MTDPQYQNLVPQNSVDDPIITHSQLVQARKSPLQCALIVRTFRKLLLDHVKDADDLRFWESLEISFDRTLIAQLKCQAISLVVRS